MADKSKVKGVVVDCKCEAKEDKHKKCVCGDKK
jgi:hypothetical protein